MRIHLLALVLSPVLVLALPQQSGAQTPEGIARIEVLPGWIMADGRQMAALKVTLAPGWKTYWRAPGDAGIPPLFDWTGSRNVTGVTFHWPTPEVFDLNGMRSLGYHDGVVIPIELSTAGGDITQLAGTVDMGVCQDICVPVSLSFDGTLSPATRHDPEIVAALVDQPVTGADAGAGKVICTTDPIRDGMRVTMTIDLPPQGTPEVVVIESGDPFVWTSEATVDRQGDQIIAVADLIPVNGQAFALNRSAVRTTVLGQTGAVDLMGCTGG